jgi:hypothetical protein
VRVALADYLVRRLLTLILPRVHGSVAIEVMGIRRHHHCRGGGRGRGGKDNADGGGLGLTTPFVLDRTNCHVPLSLLVAGRTPMLEVLLCISSAVPSSSKSAAPATAPSNDGIQSAVVSAVGEELARAEQRVWGDGSDALHLLMQMAIPPIGIPPLPGKQGRTTVDRTTADCAGASKPPPADHGVTPSHPIAGQF